MDGGWSRDVYQIQPRGAASYGVTTIDSYKSGSTVVLAENEQRKHVYYMGHYVGENGREFVHWGRKGGHDGIRPHSNGHYMSSCQEPSS